jgi:hypothetical protein
MKGEIVDWKARGIKDRDSMLKVTSVEADSMSKRMAVVERAARPIQQVEGAANGNKPVTFLAHHAIRAADLSKAFRRDLRLQDKPST